MSTIDDVLIERIYSPLSGWARDRLGIGQWRVSIECLNGSVAFYVAAVAIELGSKGIQDGAFVTMLRALAWLLILEAIRRRAHRQAASSVGMRTARTGEWMFRIVLCATLPLSFAYAGGPTNLCYSASLLLLVCHLYFKAADAPPPQPRGQLARQPA